MQNNLIDECIEWNRRKADAAKEDRDRNRYEDNVRRLMEMKKEQTPDG